jgi:hypothetical protein
MKLSRKQLPVLIGIILILGVGNVAFALLYMSRSVDITGGVSVVGTIEVYDEDAVTIMTSYDFPNFTGGVAGEGIKYFYINNTGNQPVNVNWNISSSSLIWNPISVGYEHEEAAVTKYEFFVQNASSLDYVAPNSYPTPGSVYIDVGESAYMRIMHQYTGNPNTAEQYSLTMTFYAEDALASVDTDGDGVGDNADAFPTDPTEWADTDGDGVGDNADPNPTSNLDSDADGLSDDYETVISGTDPFDASSN